MRSAVVEGPCHAVATRSNTTSNARADIGMAQQLSCSLGRYGGSESGEVYTASSAAALILVRVGGLAVAGHGLRVVNLFEHPQPD